MPVTARFPPMAGNRESSGRATGYWHNGCFTRFDQKFLIVAVKVQLDGFVGRPVKFDRFGFIDSDSVLRHDDLSFPDFYPDRARPAFLGASLD